ncbi:oxysterol-binding protein-related protein 4B [Tripterygium wilfordii]|uniref:Oxysterol-binding protein-related protein 4B n=1 Tax=Tripterygium wilfordii TaxID=458696 RepID=A0A7J7DTD1_TRIWF|nr:oxysterol-binding protein-related protein 4C-like isoform X2 [Tripterygium wilfordii]KAF5749386.1 oxysterol-binding protein-related protein 4B [Tripterygium wilfordii]
MCVVQVGEGKEQQQPEREVVLTKPLSLDIGESEGDYKAPNLLRRVLSLFKNLRPGSDLTHFQLPPVFNFPKSQLQCFGESLYCVNKDLLSGCNQEKNPLNRFLCVVGWSICTSTRPVIFGLAPYNPVLGETHHVSRGSLNVLLEQVSHHPPVSALYATDEKENVETIWCQNPVPKFQGASVETVVHGKRQLKLVSKGETYVMNSPNLFIRFLPIPGVDWVGNVKIHCKETGLEADLCYKTDSFLGLRGKPRYIKGKIYDFSTSKILYEIEGQWDRTVTAKDVNNGKCTVIYNAKEIISGLKTPTTKDSQEVWPSESAVVWSEVSQGILSKDWEKAREAKKTVEEKQRELLRERASRGETWVPKHFTVTYTKEGGWDCSPIQNSVPPAPISVPL